MSLVFNSLKELEHALPTLTGKMVDASFQVLVEAADFMVTIAQAHCLVDTGTLQDSIRREITEKTDLSAKVRVVAGGMQFINPKSGRGCDYAVYVEAKNPFMKPAWASIRRLVLSQLKSQVAEVE